MNEGENSLLKDGENVCGSVDVDVVEGPVIDEPCPMGKLFLHHGKVLGLLHSNREVGKLEILLGERDARRAGMLRGNAALEERTAGGVCEVTFGEVDAETP